MCVATTSRAASVALAGVGVVGGRGLAETARVGVPTRRGN